VIKKFPDVWLVKMPWVERVFDGDENLSNELQSVCQSREQVKIIHPKVGFS
jgi:hypothetical protein